MSDTPPEGATHKHKGNSQYLPHYIKLVNGKVFTWLTGMVGGDNWNDIPVSDHLENYAKLEQANDNS